MYQRDVGILKEYGKTREGFNAIATFAILSANQPFVAMKAQMDGVRMNGDLSVYLYGAKRLGWRFLHMNSYPSDTKNWNLGDKLFDISRIPALGLVKAAFVAQMLGENIGCLDTHNLAKCGLEYSEVRLRKDLSANNQLARIDKYIHCVHSYGNAEWWWDQWCEEMAKPGTSLDTADKVSAFHVTAVMG